MSAHKVGRAVLADKEIAEEFLPRHLHHGPVEMGENDVIGPIEAAHEQRAVVHRVDERHRRAGHQRVRMAVEAHRRRAQPQFRCPLARPAQQRTVAQVDAVKKSKRNHARSCFVHTSKKLLTVVKVCPLTVPRSKNSPVSL